MKTIGIIVGLVALISMYGFETNQEVKSSKEKEDVTLPGVWLAVSETSGGRIVPVVDRKYCFSSEFLTEESVVGRSGRRQFLLYDAVFEKNKGTSFARWDFRLYANPDKGSTHKPRTEAVSMGYGAIWIVDNAGVVVFSEHPIDAEFADLHEIQESTSGFKIYSLYRTNEVPISRNDAARSFLKQFLEGGKGKLSGVEKELYGGWEDELE